MASRDLCLDERRTDCPKPSLLRPVRCLICPIDLNEKYRFPAWRCVDREWLNRNLGLGAVGVLAGFLVLLFTYWAGGWK